MIDFILLGICGVIAWLVASDGPWSAAIAFVSSLIGGLIAMNYFEPLANFLQSTVAGSYEWQHRIDIIALLGLFALSVFVLRSIGELLLPTYAELDNYVYEVARWGFGGLTGLLVTAIICTSLHVAPLPREFLGFTPERGNLLGMAPDRAWLALVQHTSERSLRRVRADGRPVIFDGVVFPADPADLQSSQVWSSFPIKYATRRQHYASGGISAAAAPAPPPSAGTPGQSSPNSGIGGF